jgi:hypothetical protein
MLHTRLVCLSKYPTGLQETKPVLTVHVESDVGGERADHVIVGRLAGENGIEMTSLQLLHVQNVSDAAFGKGFIRIVNLPAVPPPRDPGSRASWKAMGLIYRFVLLKIREKELRIKRINPPICNPQSHLT